MALSNSFSTELLYNKVMEKLVVGIDLGGSNYKTTGICVLKSYKKCFRFKKPLEENIKTIKAEEILETLRPFVDKTAAVAIDAPLAFGKGKGKTRLYEKFLSQKVFRKYHLQPLPPALMPQIVLEGVALVEKLKDFGFYIDENLIEVFPTFVKKVLKRIPITRSASGGSYQDQHQFDAFVCAFLAHLHLQGQTFWLGYKDGKLFLPSLKLWKKSWQKKFKKAWGTRHPYKYRFLKVTFVSYR